MFPPLKLVFISTLITLASATRAGTNPAQPNIIVILADDLGYADVGFQGATDIPTPHINTLAREGAQFTNGYVTHPYCSPSRAGLLTGRYQQRFGHEANPEWHTRKGTIHGLPLTETLLSEVLGKAGYRTGAVGKWHLGASLDHHPIHRGFDQFYGFLSGAHQYNPRDVPFVCPCLNPREHPVPDWQAAENSPLLRQNRPVNFNGYMTDLLSEEAAAFIHRNRNQPFFLYLSYNAVHIPLQATPEYESRVSGIEDPRRRTYAAMTVAMDDGIGQVIQALRESKQDDNTLIWFFSDNGGPVARTAPTDNSPLRGYKYDLYEGGIRVPFVVRWPNRVKAGQVLHQPVISLDVFATALALSGAEVPEGVKLDGADLTPLLTGTTTAPPHPTLYWRDGGSARKKFAIRDGNWKLVKHGPNGSQELFDLSTDAGETHDVSDDHPDVVERLKNKYDAWSAELVEPLFYRTPYVLDGI